MCVVLEGHEGTKTRRRTLVTGKLRVFVFSWLILGGPAFAAADHTLVVLSHSNHTVYELDPASGPIVHEFVAPDQPHEAAVTSDGSTIFASVPAAGFVEILDGKTFKEKGRIETDYFQRSPQARRGRGGAPAGPPNT